jgi:Tat protein translocase TatB subunit
MPQLGPMEVLVVLVVALLVFGPERLPDMARRVGRFMTEIRRMADEVKEEFETGLDMDADDAVVDDERDVDIVTEHPVAEAIATDNGLASQPPDAEPAPPLARLQKHKPSADAAVTSDDDAAPDAEAPPIARLQGGDGRAAQPSDSSTTGDGDPR